MWHSSEHTHTHTHTLPIQVHTHTVHTHTHTHTRRSGQPFMLWHRGAVEGSVPCSRVTQSWYWGWRERCIFTPPPPTIPAGPRLKLTTFRLRVRLSTTTSPTSPLCSLLHIVMLFYCFNKRALLIFSSMHPLVASGWKTVSFSSNRNYAF